MCDAILNGAGLIAGIAGSLLLFRFGVPAYPPKADAGSSFLLREETDEEEKGRVERADLIAKGGLALLALGFLLQFIALFFA